MLPVSLVWLFVLGGLGLFFPYYSLYLRENAGLTGTQVGAVLAVLPLVGIVAQPLWGHAADRSGARARVLALLALGASVGYAALVLANGFVALLLATAALACFSAPLIPTTLAVTLAVTRARGPHAFGLARVWGTVGFLLAVVGFPFVLDAVQDARGLVAREGGPSEPGLAVMFPLTGVLVFLGALVALAIPRGGEVSLRAPRGDWRRLLRNGPYLRLLGFAFCAYLLLQGPMGLFPIFVRAHGGSLDSVSRLWIPMLLLEIPLIALSGTSLQRLGARGLLAVGTLAGGARWAASVMAPDPSWLFPIQLLHGVTVAGLVVGAPLYVEAVVPERLRTTGQGILAMLGVSAGGISSNLGSGWLLEHYGVDAPYLVGGFGALLLAALLPILLPRPLPSSTG